MILRNKNIQQLKDADVVFDALIIGGGINGAVSAAALAAKGAKVALVDKGDFAGLTSSNSSNLAWGGIKYLESHEYSLVNKLCKSRNQLMDSYPSTVKEIRFLTVISKGFRFPSWFVYLGTILYWIMGRFYTQAPHYLTANKIKQREPAINVSTAIGGFEYSDAYLFDNDARFVFNFIRSSMNKGCIAANYVESIDAVREQTLWNVSVRDTINDDVFTIRSNVLINACGPYVDSHNLIAKQKTDYRHLFSKGIHLIIDRVSTEEKVLTFFASDGRLFFVIPMGDKTCVGTTDTQVADPDVNVTKEDRQFVLDNINKLLDMDRPITREDIIAERCGVRPLAQQVSRDDDDIADWVKLSRKHAIETNDIDNHLSIYGGKTTDCINVGDEVAEIVEQMGVELPHTDNIWYGEDTDNMRDVFYQKAKSMNLDALGSNITTEPLSQRLWRRYASAAIDMLDDIEQNPSQAQPAIAGSEFIRSEITYIAQHEMVTKLDDFLRRRSKLSQTIRKDELLANTDLLNICQLLFGDQAEQKYQEYCNSVR
jgi:alpha-glycerophosphate oxidase/glycerol-3-phosphate dehydrogenase